MYLIAFPLLIIPFALYNMIAFLLNLNFATARCSACRCCRARSMAVSIGDMLVILGVLLLYFEISRRRGSPASRSWTTCCR